MLNKQYSDKERVEIIEQQRKSGLSIPEFCRQSGIGDKTFYRWRKRFNGASEAIVRKTSAVSSNPGIKTESPRALAAKSSKTANRTTPRKEIKEVKKRDPLSEEGFIEIRSPSSSCCQAKTQLAVVLVALPLVLLLQVLVLLELKRL